MEKTYLESTKKLFTYYKKLGDDAMAQVADEKLFFQPNEDSNSIAIIVQHMAGNMLSRWTDFLTSDGEKDWNLKPTSPIDKRCLNIGIKVGIVCLMP